MTAALDAPVAPLPPPARRGFRVLGLLLGALSDVLLTAGIVLVAFCAYELWWTNVQSAQERDRTVRQLERSWAVAGGSSGGSASAPAAPASRVPAGPEHWGPTHTGTPFALLRIPRLGRSWSEPLVEGVEAPQLKEGIGHYVGTALPGQLGNVGLAGHRATNGEPFRDLDRMRVGDQVVVETATRVYTYVVIKPWYLVSPTTLAVIAPVPGHPGARPTERRLTLTTCNPRWASTQRLIVETRLVSIRAKGA
ncbi:sortase A [Motilibacter rhizosphaerae]|uniref:Sortase A n=1 Tax=Motilibacter rhizosphaerae TaxID=598652 RepID=A0A4Q7NVG3_9ACTN|nr:class E sortase [Motilibacter rhizosphaerae]RZS91243.1 sortase A [Motilibacter rhizosphaerae]